MSTSTAPTFLSLSQRAGYNADQFRAAIQQAIYGLRVAMPCIVQSFDPVKQTVKVLPTVMEKVLQNKDGIPTPTDLQWTRPFGDIPVLMPSGGPFVLTFPIQTGDECLVIFADMCIDSWWQSGGINNSQLDKRRHDLSDGFAIIGPRSIPKAIGSYNTTEPELRTADGSIKLAFTATGFKVTGTLEVTGGVTLDSTLMVTGDATLSGPDNLVNGYTKP